MRSARRAVITDKSTRSRRRAHETNIGTCASGGKDPPPDSFGFSVASLLRCWPLDKCEKNDSIFCFLAAGCFDGIPNSLRYIQSRGYRERSDQQYTVQVAQQL